MNRSSISLCRYLVDDRLKDLHESSEVFGSSQAVWPLWFLLTNVQLALHELSRTSSCHSCLYSTSFPHLRDHVLFFCPACLASCVFESSLPGSYYKVPSFLCFPLFLQVYICRCQTKRTILHTTQTVFSRQFTRDLPLPFNQIQDLYRSVDLQALAVYLWDTWGSLWDKPI